MVLIRPLSPRPFGRSGHKVRRYLVIEKRYRPRPKIGVRSYVADDMPTLTKPVVFFTRPARLEWDDLEFRGIRSAISAYYEAGREMSATKEKDENGEVSEEFLRAQNEFRRTWAVCKDMAYHVFNTEPLTVRDLFLRAEMLTMHYGDGQLDELFDYGCPAHSMLGGLLEAIWKVGAAANVTEIAGTKSSISPSFTRPRPTAIGGAVPGEGKLDQEQSKLYRAYRRAFDAFVEVLEREPERDGFLEREQWRRQLSAADGELERALGALLERPTETWADVAELGIVAHDHSWNRHSQQYCWRDCPASIVGPLVLGILTVKPGDAVLHRRPPNWVSPLRGKLG